MAWTESGPNGACVPRLQPAGGVPEVMPYHPTAGAAAPPGNHAAAGRLLTSAAVALAFLAALLYPFARDARSVPPVSAQGGASAAAGFPAPLNYGFDGRPVTSPLRVTNWDFETDAEVLEAPANYEFESDLDDWTTSGTVAHESAACESGYGDCVKLTTNGAFVIQDDWMDVPDGAQYITFRYKSTGTMYIIVERQGYTSGSHGISSSGGVWTKGAIPVYASYTGHTIKVKAYKGYSSGDLYVDDVGALELAFPGWTTTGSAIRDSRGSPSDHYALLKSTMASVKSEEVTIPDDAQYILHDMLLPSASRLDLIADGLSPGKSWTSSAMGVGWHTNVLWAIPGGWRGHTTQIRASAMQAGDGVGFDRGVRFHWRIPHWIPGAVEKWSVASEDGILGHYLQYSNGLPDSVVSSAFVVPSDAPLATYWFNQASNSSHSMAVLESPYTGSGTTVVPTVFGAKPWQVRLVDLSAWAGEPIKLRFVVQGTVKLDEIASNFDERACSPCVPSIGVGDPVDSSTGAFTLQRTDLAIEAPGMDLDFRRRYLARGAFTGTLGYRWIHNWDWRIERVAADGSVLLRYGDGSLHAFPYDDGFDQESTSNDRLERVGSPGNYTYTLLTRDQIRYDFGASGRLAQVRDRHDNAAELTYDGGGLLERVALADGRALTFTYASGLLTAVEDPLARQIEFGYVHEGMPLLATVTDTLGHATEYTYDADRLGSGTDGRGVVVFANTYDGASRVIRQQDAGGGVMTLAYDAPESGYTTVTRADGVDVRYGFDSHFHTLDEVIDPDGLNVRRAWEYDGAGRQAFFTRTATIDTFTEYDAYGNLLLRVDPIGRESRYGYTEENDVLTATLPAGRSIENEYEAGSLIRRTETVTHPTYVEPLVLAATYEHAPNGRLAQVVDVRGFTTTYGYDAYAYGQVVTSHVGASQVVTRAMEHNVVGWRVMDDDGLGNRMTYDYDDRGRVVTSTDALDSTVVREYDATGNLVALTDELGRTRQMAYDGLNRLISETNALTHTVLYGYDPLGNRTSIARSVGGVTVTEVFTYDAASRLVAERDGEGGVRTYAYDDAGRRIAGTDPATGLATTMTYDDADRMLTLTDPLSHTTELTYTLADHTRVVTDAKGSATTFDYDPLGRLLSVLDAENQLTRYEYDGAGNRTRLLDAKDHERLYEYDGLSRRTAELLFESPTVQHRTSYDYDAGGRLIERTDALENTTTYDHDPLGRLVAVDYPTGTADVAFTYDAAGNRMAMTDGTGATEYEYDAADRVVRVTSLPDVGEAVTVTYAYDEAHRRTTLGYPGGDEVTLAYDRAHRLASVTDWADRETRYEYDESGRLLAAELPNGVASIYGYDIAGRLVTVTHGITSTVLAELVYELDAVDNRLSRTGSGPLGSQDYEYDKLYRLTAVDYGDDTVAYAYDASGNRERMVRVTPGGTVTTTYNFDALDRLTETNDGGAAVTYGWDDNGNQLAKGGSTFSYDAADRLVAASVAGTASSFAYNGDGVRLGKVVTTTGTVSTTYVVDTVGGLATVLADGGTRYVPGVGGVLAEIDGGGDDLYHLTDGLGSTVLLTDADGEVQATIDYDAFGAVRDVTGSAETEFTFAGEQADADADLIFLRARYYDPETGRFLSRDSAGGVPVVPASLNPYAYAHNNPVMLTDPSGEIVPILALAWAITELGLTAHDAHEMYKVWRDECATESERAFATGIFLAGVYGPGGGYGSVDDAVRWISRHSGPLGRFAEIPMLRRLLGRFGIGASAARRGTAAVDDMLRSAQQLDRNYMTRAGRALQKHGDGPGSVFPRSSGTAAERNAQGQQILEEILGSSTHRTRANRSGGQDIFDTATGRGARFDGDGSFIGFLEP